MKILFASDSFKGSITSQKSASLLEKAAKEVFCDCTTLSVPVADGGEGTVDTIIAAENGKKIHTKVHDPLGNQIEAYYGGIDDKRAVIEMAAASGLPLIPKEKRNPLMTSSYGTGELIRDALDKGFYDIYIAIGGSATNDGGMGAMKALGVRFLDKDGKELDGCGRDLLSVETIDVSGIHPRIKEANITVMCDVTNPLCGKNGATYTYGVQKGGNPKTLDTLEAGMLHYSDAILRCCKTDPKTIVGGGAAGGLGAALSVFLNGKMLSGIETILDLIHFDERLKGVDLVVTGEGQTDGQSCFGKVMQGVGMHAKAAGIPAIGLSGSLGEGSFKIYEHGIESIMTTVNAPMTLDEAMKRADELYYDAALRMFRMVRVGMKISKPLL